MLPPRGFALVSPRFPLQDSEQQGGPLEPEGFRAQGLGFGGLELQLWQDLGSRGLGQVSGPTPTDIR